jgi:hypothetical protein
VCGIRVTREIDRLARWELEDILELATDVHQDLRALLNGSSLATSNVAISTTRNALADCASPETDTEEAFTDIDNDTHDLSIILLLKSLANGREHDVKPELINLNVALLLELV